MKTFHAIAAGALALSLAACANSEAASPQSAATSEEGENGAFGILNAGVRAEIGKEGEAVKFLFDPLYDDHFGSLEPLDEALIDRIISGAAPYDNVAAVFVSHAHGDHFSASQFNRLMAAQGEVRLVAPSQAIEQMREHEGWNPLYASRITAISLENGEQAESFEIAGATIEAFRSPHAGWPDRHAQVHNLTYRVSIEANEGRFDRVMHLGDADPGTEHYAEHGEFLSRARTGLAIVPFWHFSVDDPDALIDKTLNAESSVGMHVPVSEPAWLAETGRDYFTGEGQRVEVPETP